MRELGEELEVTGLSENNFKFISSFELNFMGVSVNTFV